MKKLKLQVQMSIDGFIAGPNGEMDWMAWNWDDELKEYINELTASIDCILLGRKLAEGFIPHWADIAADPDNPEVASGKRFTDLPKVVFTKTLSSSQWDNTSLAKGDFFEEVNSLKQQAGRDMITYGGGEFVSNLIKANLIDEYHLCVNPSALGAGMSIFERRTDLQLMTSKAFSCGVTVLKYSSKK